jgi:RNA polymerase sigma-70 factor (ECF subfamily)
MTNHLSLYLNCEAERIREAVGGDVQAFRDLVVQYHPLAYSMAYKVLDDPQDAEEVAQDAFVKIHRALAGFRGEASFKTWLTRIVLRLSLNRRRDRSRSSWHRLGLHLHQDPDRDHPAPGAQTPETQCIARETRQFVRQLVDELPAALRQVVALNSFEELSYEEIAQILKVPLGTVSSRLYSARKKLLGRLRRQDLI